MNTLQEAINYIQQGSFISAKVKEKLLVQVNLVEESKLKKIIVFLKNQEILIASAQQKEVNRNQIMLKEKYKMIHQFFSEKQNKIRIMTEKRQRQREDVNLEKLFKNIS